MYFMYVTLEVLKLSGWLNADAPCRESKEGIRCEVRPRGAGGRLAVAVHAHGAGEGKAEARVLWRAAPGCIGYHRCAHPLLGFLDEIACLDDLLIFFAAGRRRIKPDRSSLWGGDAKKNPVEYANGTRQTIQLWDQFRVWDPGD